MQRVVAELCSQAQALHGRHVMQAHAQRLAGVTCGEREQVTRRNPRLHEHFRAGDQANGAVVNAGHIQGCATNRAVHGGDDARINVWRETIEATHSSFLRLVDVDGQAGAVTVLHNVTDERLNVTLREGRTAGDVVVSVRVRVELLTVRASRDWFTVSVHEGADGQFSLVN